MSIFRLCYISKLARSTEPDNQDSLLLNVVAQGDDTMKDTACPHAVFCPRCRDSFLLFEGLYIFPTISNPMLPSKS